MGRGASAGQGGLASLLLFVSFTVFSLFDIWSSNRRCALLSDERLPRWRDGLLILVGTDDALKSVNGQPKWTDKHCN
jgi:hypothetical protein